VKAKLNKGLRRRKTSEKIVELRRKEEREIPPRRHT
jgi:hypothetical protein